MAWAYWNDFHGRMDQWIYFHAFSENYLAFVKEENKEELREKLEEFYNLLFYTDLLDLALEHQLYHYYADSYAFPSSVRVENIPSSGQISLYLLASEQKHQSYSVNVAIKHVSGIDNRRYPVASGLNIWELDLNGYTDVSEVNVSLPLGSSFSYVALVPSGTEFDAYSYDEDGRLRVHFDGVGNLEEYEYDRAGRVICVKDGKKHIRKECLYHTLPADDTTVCP